MKRIEAVYIAISELSDRSSAKVLTKRASQIYGREIKYGLVVVYRLRWRKETRQKKKDMRTHADCPGRNMLNDQLVNMVHLRRLFHFFSSTGVRPEDLSTLIGKGKGKFHSLDQLVIAAEDISKLQMTEK